MSTWGRLVPEDPLFTTAPLFSPLTSHSLKPHGLTTPARETHYIFNRWHRVLVPIRGVHPPPEIGSVRQRQIRRARPPASSAEGPRRVEKVQCQARAQYASPHEPASERQPRAGHRPSIIGILRTL